MQHEFNTICEELFALVGTHKVATIVSIGRSTKIFEEFQWYPYHFISVPLTRFRALDLSAPDAWAKRFSPAILEGLQRHFSSHGVIPEAIQGELLVLDFVISGQTLIGAIKGLRELYPNLPIQGIGLFHDPNRDKDLQELFPSAQITFLDISKYKGYLRLLRLRAFKDIYPHFAHEIEN